LVLIKIFTTFTPYLINYLKNRKMETSVLFTKETQKIEKGEGTFIIFRKVMDLKASIIGTYCYSIRFYKTGSDCALRVPFSTTVEKKAIKVVNDFLNA